MRLASAMKFSVGRWGLLFAAIIILSLAACGGDPTEQPISTAEAGTPAATPSPTIDTATETATVTATPVSTSTPGPTSEGATPPPTTSATLPATPTSSLVFELLARQDGAGVETDAVRVMGITGVDAVVGVNGIPVDVSSDGRFSYDLQLDEGINLIEVEAADLSGETAGEQVAVFFISPTAGLPFALYYPPDGLEVSTETILVAGGTRPDAIVGVNGDPVEINALGIFSTTVTLEEGPNFIEVVATDIQGNVRFQTVAAFYLP